MADPAVLVVEFDEKERRRIGSWLAQAGFQALMCPGPRAPDYTCLGGRGMPCPLARDADIVVLDLRLASDEMMTGTAGWEILVYYVSNGKKVVALSGDEDSVHPFADDRVTVIKRPPDRDAVVAAVRALAKSGLSGDPDADHPAD